MAKKIILRILCVLCLAASVAMYFISPWIKVFGFKDKEIKTIRSEVKAISKQISNLSKNDRLLDILEDAGLDIDKSDINSFATQFATTADGILDMEYNPVDISILSFKAIKISKTFDAMLEDEEALTAVKSFMGSTVRDAIDAYEAARPYLYYSLIYTGILAVLAIFSILGIVFSCRGKCRGFVVTYFILSVLFVAAMVGGTILGNMYAHSQSILAEGINIYPFYGPAAVFMTSLLAMIFILNEKKVSKKLAQA